jgi:hypothetical protein
MSEVVPADGTICLVTIHGIGFQRAPGANGSDGYADLLHEHLSLALGAGLLSDDPHRVDLRNGQAGKYGTIYVRSQFSPSAGAAETIEEGLRRLGVWTSDRREGQGEVVPGEIGQLVESGKRIAHIALVYAHPENRALQHVGAAVETLAKSVVSALNYGTPWDIAQMLVADIRVAGGSGPPSPISLRPRDTPHQTSMPWHQTTDDGSNPPGVLGVIRALEEDITTYVCRNDLREKVRGFVREALLRLSSRTDVSGIVINSHSQGTTVAYDVLRTLPPSAIRKVRLLLCSGSPLRKYATLYAWGTELAQLGTVDQWVNFYDPHDLVGDPLGPRDWRPGSDVDPRSLEQGLFQVIDDAGLHTACTIQDEKVNNVQNSPRGGYPPHNYWDNQTDWIPKVAPLLKKLAQQGAVP